MKQTIRDPNVSSRLKLEATDNKINSLLAAFDQFQLSFD